MARWPSETLSHLPLLNTAAHHQASNDTDDEEIRRCGGGKRRRREWWWDLVRLRLVRVRDPLRQVDPDFFGRLNPCLRDRRSVTALQRGTKTEAAGKCR